jgi:hypothetical protein
MLKEFRARLRLRRLQNKRKYLSDSLVITKSRLSADPVEMALNEIEIEEIEDELKVIEEEIVLLQNA